ncbi:PhzF family phenazine biosynthesis protein [Wenyingzhuangia sp. IMCC45533]
MERIIYQVDAFSTEKFKGNPAGVMILKEDLSEELMQKIAMEMNLSETAFVNISHEPFSIRYFTPTIEIPLCGHATLASAHILYETQIVNQQNDINFNCKAGLLNIKKGSEGIKMVFPKYSVQKINSIDVFKDIIGFEPLESYSSENGWTIAVAKNEIDIQNAQPRFSEMSLHGVGNLMITALSERNNVDFVVRCFAPVAGINEDPVTGSAQCGLVPLWNLKTGKTKFNVEQLSKRTGKLAVQLINDKVEIVGKSVTIFKAEMYI